MKPRITLASQSMRGCSAFGYYDWRCASAGCVGYGKSPKEAYRAWLRTKRGTYL